MTGRRWTTPLLITALLASAAAFLAAYRANQALDARNVELGRLAEEAEARAAAWEKRATDPGNGIRANGALRVVNGKLLNRTGRPMQLRGMSSHGLTWFPEFINARAMRDVKARGANVFRASMYTDNRPGGYSESDASRRMNETFMLLAVENALAVDMYVIVDWHVLKDENPLRHIDGAIAFFKDMSARYANEPGVIYEICNEPNGEATWADIRQYAEHVIPVIRENSPGALVLVGTPDFPADVLSVRASPLALDNVMYTYHFYTGTSDGYYKHALETMMAEGLPVFVSEWGVSTDASSGELDVEEAREFIEFARLHRISWVNWSLSNADEDYSAIRREVTKLSGWTDDDLSVSGALVFDALKDPD